MTAYILVKKLTLLVSIDLEERSLLIYINIYLQLSVRGHKDHLTCITEEIMLWIDESLSILKRGGFI